MKRSCKIRRSGAKLKRGAVKKNKNTNHSKNKKASQSGGAPGDLLLSISRDDASMHEFYCMAVQPTQPLVAVGGDGGVGVLHINCTLGQPPSKKYIGKAFAHNPVTCLAFHPVHPLLACASFTEVVLYRTDDMLPRYHETTTVVYDEDEYVPSEYEAAPHLTTAAVVLKETTGEFTQVAFHPTELLVACSCETADDPTIKLFRISPDYSSVSLVKSTTIQKGLAVSTLVFTSDGTCIVCIQEHIVALCRVDGRAARCSEYVNEGELRTTSVAFNSHERDIMHFGNNDGAVSRVGVNPSTASLRAVPSVMPTKLHASAVTSIAFHPSGDVIITGAQDGAKMWEYDAEAGGKTPIVQLGEANAQPVRSVAANVNFIAVCREAGIDIYNYGWSRGKRIRPSIRSIALEAAAIPPPLVLPQTEFGKTSGENMKVRVAQTVPEYHEMCATAEKNHDECSKAACPVCFDEFITREKLAQPVFFHETVFMNSNGVEKKMWTCPLHLKDMIELVKLGTPVSCPSCRKKMDIKRQELTIVVELYRKNQKILETRGAVNAHASRIGSVFKGYLTRKSSPGKAVANKIKGIYASKIGSAFRGHLTRKSSPGKAVAKQVARQKEYSASRKAFSQEYHKRKIDAVVAIAKFTGHSPDDTGVIFEEQFSRAGGDLDEAVRATTELLFAKSRQQALADPIRTMRARDSQQHRDDFFAAAAARPATTGRNSKGSEMNHSSYNK